MYLVQILLPLKDNQDKAFPESKFSAVEKELMDKFGGVTAYRQAPAKGLWESKQKPVQDHIIIVEVMTEALEKAWWTEYRNKLEKSFRQQVIVIRAQAIQIL